MKLSSFIKINPADSVVVCLRPMQKGEVIETAIVRFSFSRME